MRLLGSVEIPEEDLAPGKSSIAANNCIQQLSNSKGQGSAENQGEVRAWDGVARQSPTLVPLLLSLAVPTDGGSARGRVRERSQWQSTLSKYGIHEVVQSVGAGGSNRAFPWERCQRCLGGLSPHMGMVPGEA